MYGGLRKAIYVSDLAKGQIWMQIIECAAQFPLIIWT